MKFNAFNEISPSIEDTKKLLKPKKFGEWLKLGFVAMMSGNGSGGGGGGGGRGINFSIPSGGDGGELGGNESFSSITGNAVDSVKAKIGGLAYAIAPLVVLLFLLMVLLSYIKSVFTFMFIECIDSRKTLVTKYWHNNQGVGLSLFLFKVLMTFLVLAVIGLCALPFIIPIASMGFEAYFDNFALVSLLWIIPLVLLLITFFIIFGLFMTLVFNFAVPHMYFHRVPIKPSIKATFNKIWQKKLETLIFILAKIVISIVTGIAAVLMAIVLMIPLLIIAIPFGLIFYGLVVSFGWSAGLITALVIVGLATIIFFVYVFSVCFLPFSTYSWHFTLRNYKLLMK